MDIQLPIMDGYEATRRIKADAALRSIPIIAVTSYALSREEKTARAASNDQEHSSRFVCGKRRIGRQAKGSSNRGPAPMARANYRASGR